MHFDKGWRRLTFSKPFKAGGAHSDPLELQVLDGSLVGGAATAHHPPAASAVVPSHCQLELHIAALRQMLSEKNPLSLFQACYLTMCDSLVRDPHGSHISETLLWSKRRPGEGGHSLLSRVERGATVLLLLDGRVDCLQPVVTVIDGSSPDREASDVAGDAELLLELLVAGHTQAQLVQIKAVGHFQPSCFACPRTLSDTLL